MKIEICERLIASWLNHIKGCQIVQTNWKPSPLTTEIDTGKVSAITSFINDVKNEMKDDGLDIFKKSTVNQFIMQCEIDVVGVKIKDTAIDELYFIDSAFHENGLGYKNPVANVLKKILRAVVVADVVLKTVPPKVVFVAPLCGKKLKKSLEDSVAKLYGVITKYYPISMPTLIFNEDFYSQIYAPLIEQIDNVSDDNDLFLRAMKASKIAESFAPTPTPAKSTKKASAPAVPATTATGSGLKIGAYAKSVFTKLLTTGQLSPAQISNLTDKKYCSKTFKLSYAVLADYSSSADPAYYYKDGRVLGLYLICREWKEISRAHIDAWIAKNGFTV